MYRNILMVFCLFSFFMFISLCAFAKGVDFAVTLENSPKISRFKGFTAVVLPDTLKLIDQDSLKLYVNGEDYSNQLKFTMDANSGSLYISFKPRYPLPVGHVVQKISGTTKEGDYFEKHWAFEVDPSADGELAGFFGTLRKDANNINAHLGIARIYEKKYLLQDAQNEYLTVLQLDPTNEKARKAYERIFSLWDQKMITYDKLSIDVFMDTGLLKLGKLLIFNLKITNKGEKPVTIAPDKWTLIDETGVPLDVVSSLSAYPKKALDKKWVSLDDYARLAYYLKNHSFPLLKGQDIAPGASVEGYLVFIFSTKSTKVVLSVSDQDVGDHKETFLFPFVLP